MIPKDYNSLSNSSIFWDDCRTKSLRKALLNLKRQSTKYNSKIRQPNFLLEGINKTKRSILYKNDSILREKEMMSIQNNTEDKDKRRRKTKGDKSNNESIVINLFSPNNKEHNESFFTHNCKFNIQKVYTF